jgi:integrase
MNTQDTQTDDNLRRNRKMSLPNTGFDHVSRLDKSNLHSDIRAFIDTKGLRSKNTAVAYEGDIKKFFKTTRNKDLEFVTIEDVTSFKHSEFAAYQAYISKQYSNSTVNRNMTAIKQLMEFLSRDYPDVRVQVFGTDRLHEDPKSYGVLSLDESMQMIEIVRVQRKGKEKALLMEMAIRTSIRINALMELKWEDITKHSDDIYVVTAIDKGEKRDNKPIPKELYEKLLALKSEDEFVFHLDKKTCNAMIKMACEEMGISEKRNVTFHSLKKVGINWVIDSGGSVLDAAKQGNHGNIQTTYKFYMDKTKDYGKMAGLNMGSDVDTSGFEKMNKEELLELIKSASYQVKVELLRGLNK